MIISFIWLVVVAAIFAMAYTLIRRLDLTEPVKMVLLFLLAAIGLYIAASIIIGMVNRPVVGVVISFLGYR